MRPTGGSIRRVDVLHFEHAAADMQVALWERDFNSGFTQLLLHREIEIAPITARSIAHLAAPDDQLKINGIFAEFLQENAGRRIFQSVRVFAGGGEQRLADFVHVAAVGYPHRQAKPHPRIAVGPVRHRRVDEFRVRDNHGDVVVGYNHGAAGPNMLHLTGNSRDFHSVAHRDWTLSQNNEAADKIARDVLQTKANADANRASKNRQGPEVNAGIIENDKDSDDEDDVADDLRNCVLQRPIEPAFREKAIEEKTFRPG